MARSLWTLAGLLGSTEAFGPGTTLQNLPRTYTTTTTTTTPVASSVEGLADNYGEPGSRPEFADGFVSSPYWAEKLGIEATVDTAQCPSTHFTRKKGSKSRAHNDKFISCYDEAIGCANYPRATCSADCVFQGCASETVDNFFNLSAYDINHDLVDFNDYKGKVVLVVNVASF